MTLIIAGSVQVPPENLERFRPLMKAISRILSAYFGGLGVALPRLVVNDATVAVFHKSLSRQDSRSKLVRPPASGAAHAEGYKNEGPLRGIV